MNLKSRLRLASAAAVAMAVVLASLVIYFVAREQLSDQLDADLQDSARNARVVPSASGFPVITLPAPAPGGARGKARLIRSDGLVSQAESMALSVTDRDVSVAAGRSPAYFRDVVVDGVHLRILTQRVTSDTALQVIRPLDEIERSLQRLAIILLVVGAGGVALAAGLGGLVARTALRPVQRLTDAAEHVTTTGDLSQRIDAFGRDELSRLATSFNSMLGALEESVRTQSQLVADASHELRTPLTSVRTNIEVLAQSERLPPQERRQLVADVVVQLEELTALVADLMELAHGNRPVEATEEVRLDLLVNDAVQRAQRRWPHSQFRIDAEPTIVTATPARLDRAIGNLLDNATKWNSEGKPVEVVVTRGEVTVRDHGPGIAPEDQPYVFDRFYRAPSARGLPGSGLGLAIVRQVAESHGGSVEAESAEGGGARMRLRLSTIS